jgi:hypothetical protein
MITDGTAVLLKSVRLELVEATTGGGGGLATVNTADPLVAPFVAEMTALPPPTAFANPAAVTVATDGVADDHVTWPVRSRVEPSLYLPVAWNC